MNKIFVRKRAPKLDKRAIRIRTKRVRDSEENIIAVPTLDAQDPNFGMQLQKVFSKNVAYALKAIKAFKKTSKSRRGAENR